MKKNRAQSSLEFLYTSSFMVLVMVLCTIVYYQSSRDAASLSAYAEARRICQSVASLISAVDAAGDGTSAAFVRPSSLAGENYTIYVMGPNRSIAVAYAAQGAGCLFSTTAISNGSASSFNMTKDSEIRKINGGVLVG